MLPTQIPLSLPGASIKLQPNFPIDSRYDIIITLNSQTEFKLRKAYLKCWSNYFQRELKSSVSTLNITEQFNPVHFTNTMSIFYAHTPKISLEQLISYYQIANFLEIKQIICQLRDHIITFHNNFDNFVLLKQSIRRNDKKLKQFVLNNFLANNFQQIIKRKSQIFELELEVFKVLIQCISQNITTNKQLNWRTLNSILKQYSQKKGGSQMYLDLREQFIVESKLTAEEYSAIFSGTESKLPPISKKHNNKFQLSQILQNQSVFYGSQISNDFMKILEKYNKNNQKFNKIEAKVQKLQQRSESIHNLYGQTSNYMNELKKQFKRLNSLPVVTFTLDKSQSKPFIDELPTQHSEDVSNKVKNYQHEQNKSSTNIDNYMESQQPLTFSVKPQSIREDQVQDLERILGFDSINRGLLNLIYKANATSTKQQFLEAINGKQELLFLIYVFEDNKNIGIYTSTRIDISLSNNQDSEAFIFSLTDGTKFKTKNKSESIKFDNKHLICFSEDLKINNNVLEQMSECNWPVNYEPHKDPNNKADWLVGNQMFHVNQLQVYEIVRIQIRMEMDL